MDIAITLPKRLWDKIVSGEKAYEIRKVLPSRLWEGNRVYVFVKGTKKVMGYFRYLGAKCYHHYCEVPLQVKFNVGISIEEQYEYAEGAKEIWVWKIGDVEVFPQRDSFDFTQFLLLKRPPQSFAYVRILPYKGV